MIISNQKPNIDAVLNDQHEHSKGLQASYLFNQKGEKVFDYTKNKNELSVVNASYVADGLQFDANGEYADLDNTKQIVNSEVGTIVMKFKSLSVFADSALRHLFGKWDAATPGTFSIQKSSSNSLFFLLLDGAIHYIRINSAPSTWQTGIQLAVSWDRSNVIADGNKMAFYIDSVYTTPDSTLTANSWNQHTVSNNLYIGNDVADTNNEANSIFEYVNIYNKVLSESTLKSIKKKPYDNFYF